MADVIIYVHDSSDTNSFSYISNLRVSRGSRELLHTSTPVTGLVLGLGLEGATGVTGVTGQRLRFVATVFARPHPRDFCCHKVGSGSGAAGEPQPTSLL
jgi:hypothetical protein